MKVAVAHGPDNNVQELRKLLHGAGAQCASEDCVLWNDLAVRMGQAEVDLIVVQAADAVDWTTIIEAKSFTSAPMIAVGPNGAVEAAARQAGVAEYISDERLHGDLNEVLQRMIGGGAIRCERGEVFSVISPTAGNGGTVVAMNLASQFCGLSNGESVYVDLSAGYSKVGLCLDAQPEHTLEDVCGRIHRLDRVSLVSVFHKNETGLRMLYGTPETSSDGYLNSDVARKLMVLSRMSAATSVFQIGSDVRQPQLDAMRMSDRVVVVVRPDVPSLKRAAIMMDQLGQYGVSADRMAVAVNFWGEPGLASKQHIEEILHWKAPSYLAYDPGRVNRCTNEGCLLMQRYPRCKTARQLGKLAQSLLIKG